MRKCADSVGRWCVPINARPLLKAQAALNTSFAFAITALFFSELARPGTLTSRDALLHMTRLEMRRYLAFYLCYAVMFLAQLTVSLLVYMDVRSAKYNVESRRRSLFLFLAFSPVLAVNLVLAAANVTYFPWAPMGLLYVLHTLSALPHWVYALRYYRWLGDAELVHFEAPLVGVGADADTAAGPSRAAGTAATAPSESGHAAPSSPRPRRLSADDADGTGHATPTVRVARLVSIEDTA